jgi:1-acyl-sn-glycerol-3-phosphate acyltransferase
MKLLRINRMASTDTQEMATRPAKCTVATAVWRGIHDYAAMAGGLLYWAFCGGVLTLISLPLYYLLPRRTGERLGRKMLHHLFRSFVVYLRVTGLVYADLSGLDRLSTIKSPLIVAPNHHSLWDVVFLIAKLPQAICVMKESILRNPVLGGGARLAGFIPNDSRTRMIRAAISALRQDGQLLFFPEGTRTRPDSRWINPLKGGCAIIATRSEIPVYPVFIRSDSRFLEKGWPLWKRPDFPIRMRIDMGEPLFPEKDESAADFTLRLQHCFEYELSKADPLRRQSRNSDTTG